MNRRGFLLQAAIAPLALLAPHAQPRPLRIVARPLEFPACEVWLDGRLILNCGGFKGSPRPGVQCPGWVKEHPTDALGDVTIGAPTFRRGMVCWRPLLPADRVPPPGDPASPTTVAADPHGWRTYEARGDS